MSTIKTTTLGTQGGSTVPVDTVVNGTAKAWVNFNGTGTVAIRRAFNVSSITDNGTGQYTVNFTTAMTDAQYAAASLHEGVDYGGTTFIRTGTVNTTSIGVNSYNINNVTYNDASIFTVVIFS